MTGAAHSPVDGTGSIMCAPSCRDLVVAHSPSLALCSAPCVTVRCQAVLLHLSLPLLSPPRSVSSAGDLKAFLRRQPGGRLPESDARSLFAQVRRTTILYSGLPALLFVHAAHPAAAALPPSCPALHPLPFLHAFSILLSPCRCAGPSNSRTTAASRTGTSSPKTC